MIIGNSVILFKVLTIFVSLKSNENVLGMLVTVCYKRQELLFNWFVRLL